MPTLNWHKREEAVRAATRAPYRLLEPVAELSYGGTGSENLLIRGDNLDMLNPSFSHLPDPLVQHPAPSI